MSESDPQGSLSSRLTSIYIFVSLLNDRIAYQFQRNPAVAPVFSSVLLSVRKHIECAGWVWPKSSEFVNLCLEAGIDSQADKNTVNDLARFLLRPAIVREVGGGDWRLEGSRPYLERIGLPERRTENLRIYNTHQGERFSTRRLSRDPVRRVYNFIGFFWDELLDPISIIQGYIANVLEANSEESANFQIQKWIKQQFGFLYTNDFKFAMPKICRMLNTIFYSKGLPTLADLHTLRSGTISCGLLVSELADFLRMTKVPVRDSMHGSKTPDPYLRLALGFVIFLRFTRALRVRYGWSSLVADAVPEQSLSIEGQLGRGVMQCVSALRGMENSYLLARVFGSISEIQGLNFIFRGGILPRTGSGRTFVITGFPGVGKTVLALQKLTGVAARGGVAFYFSFEESYELIVDRLISFDLANNSRFELIAPQDDEELVRELNRLDAEVPRRGILCLYSGMSGQSFSLPAKLKSLRELVEKRWAWRAVAIDSVNALQTDAGEERPSRLALQSLVESIEVNGFLGVVISEPDTIVHQDMSYLADTIIELGLEEGGQARWVEIKKCRSQNYHAGRHPCQIQEGRGIKIYPALSAIRSSLRRRAKSTLSELRRIPLPKEVIRNNSIFQIFPKKVSEKFILPGQDGDSIDSGGMRLEVAEKSSSLIYGPPNTGKTDFALKLALANPVDIEKGEMEQPQSLLLVTFRTTERSFEQGLRSKYELLRYWNKLKYRKVRWYSPGANISAEHIISDCRSAIKECRQHGYPLERIVFDELESAELVLPSLRKEQLFWSTLVNLVATEAITTFFVFGEGFGASEAFHALQLEVDYVIRLERKNAFVMTWPEKLPDISLADLPLGAGASTPSQSIPKNLGEEEPSSERKIALILQVDGRVRDRLYVPAGMDEQSLREVAMSSEKADRYIKDSAKTELFLVRGRNFLVNIRNKD